MGAVTLTMARLMTWRRSVAAHDPSTFAEIFEDRLKHVESAVAVIEQGEGHRPELDSLRVHLIDILDVIERNPGIEAAADDLYEIAARAVTGSARERSSVSRERRIVREAALRLTDRLTSALPLQRQQ